jgi:hypothetical protein
MNTGINQLIIPAVLSLLVAAPALLAADSKKGGAPDRVSREDRKLLCNFERDVSVQLLNEWLHDRTLNDHSATCGYRDSSAQWAGACLRGRGSFVQCRALYALGSKVSALNSNKQ